MTLSSPVCECMWVTACVCVRVGVWMCWGVNNLPEAHFTIYQGSASLEHVQVGSSGLLAPGQLPPGVSPRQPLT